MRAARMRVVHVIGLGDRIVAAKVRAARSDLPRAVLVSSDELPPARDDG